MIELRPEQRTTVNKGKEILKRYQLLYLAGEMRTGKSIMSMTIVKELGFLRVLFLTVKKTIPSVQSDYDKLGHTFKTFHIENWEVFNSKRPVYNENYDVFIFDESTVLSSYPVPGKFAKAAKKLVGKKPVILMSGSPTPQSPSQIFHQLWVSHFSPFSVHSNFYSWAKEYVKIKKKWVPGHQVNDYSDGDEAKIKEVTMHYMVTLSQKEAGFESTVKEHIIKIKIKPEIYRLMDVLKKKKVYQLKNGDHIVADSAGKLHSIFHQLCSGTVIGEERTHVLDESKVEYIKENFKGKKLAIFYKYVGEGDVLRKHFPMHTDDFQVFNANKHLTFICQFISGRMGINLSSADCMIAYNIDYSSTTYFQFRERMTVHGKTEDSPLYWLFSEHGIENHVYKVVCKRKNFTLNYFNEAIKKPFYQSQQQTLIG